MSDPDDLGVPFHAQRQSAATTHAYAAPLTWWRTRSPFSFGVADRKCLVAALTRLELPQIPQWRAAANGDPAASIGVAFALLSIAEFRPATFDCAMSAVLRCALLGEAANLDMLVHVLGRRGRRHTDLPLVLLAAAWRKASPSLRHEHSSSTIERRS